MRASFFCSDSRPKCHPTAATPPKAASSSAPYSKKTNLRIERSRRSEDDGAAEPTVVFARVQSCPAPARSESEDAQHHLALPPRRLRQRGDPRPRWTRRIGTRGARGGPGLGRRELDRLGAWVVRRPLRVGCLRSGLAAAAAARGT